MSRANVAASLLATIFGDVDRLDCKYLIEGARIARLDQQEPEWWTSLVLARYPDTAHPAVGYEVEFLLKDCDGDALSLLMELTSGVSSHPTATLAASRFPLNLFKRSTDPQPEIFEGRPVADSHLHSGGSMPLSVFLNGLATSPSPIGLDGSPRRPALDSPDPLATNAPRRQRLPFLSASGVEWDAMVLLAAVRWSLRLLWFSHETGDLRNRAQLADHLLEADLVELVLKGDFWSRVKKAATSSGEADDLAIRLNCDFYDDGVCEELRLLLSSWQQAAHPKAIRRRQFAFGLIRAVVALSALATSLPGEGLDRFSNRFRLMGKVQQAVFGSRSHDSLTAWKRKFLVDTIAEIAPTPQVVAAEFRRTFKATTRSKFKDEILRDLAIHHTVFGDFCRREHSMSLTMPVGFGRRGSLYGDPPSGLSELEHVVAGCEALISISQEAHGSRLMEAIWSIDVAGLEIGSSNWPFQIGAQLLAEAEVGLMFTIHAGESFTSELNGIRRVGELFIGKVVPRRIGHALSLSEDTAKAVLGRGKPPISRVEAIMDLAWLRHATGSRDALKALEQLTPREMSAPNIEAEVWVDAFLALHNLSDVSRMLIATSGDQREAVTLAGLIDNMNTSAALELAIGALVAKVPAKLVGCNVNAALEDAELALYDEVAAAESRSAREHVLKLVRDEDVVIESCPSSNITLAGLPDYTTHPLWNWSKAPGAVEVSVSSDDPLHFGNNVLQELDALLATGKDPESVRSAIVAGLDRCSGSASRLDAPRSYDDVVNLIADPP